MAPFLPELDWPRFWAPAPEGWTQMPHLLRSQQIIDIISLRSSRPKLQERQTLSHSVLCNVPRVHPDPQHTADTRDCRS